MVSVFKMARRLRGPVGRRRRPADASQLGEQETNSRMGLPVRLGALRYWALPSSRLRASPVSKRERGSVLVSWPNSSEGADHFLRHACPDLRTTAVCDLITR